MSKCSTGEPCRLPIFTGEPSQGKAILARASRSLAYSFESDKAGVRPVSCVSSDGGITQLDAQTLFASVGQPLIADSLSS